ncbi:hypothetical protein [Lusitaniella coriacea]|uniref:hypothetical protein n=1 Tax=Lusitaniella coriacea TaxID=1983105 RepID=UPI003CF0C8AA
MKFFLTATVSSFVLFLGGCYGPSPENTAAPGEQQIDKAKEAQETVEQQTAPTLEQVEQEQNQESE